MLSNCLCRHKPSVQWLGESLDSRSGAQRVLIRGELSRITGERLPNVRRQTWQCWEEAAAGNGFISVRWQQPKDVPLLFATSAVAAVVAVVVLQLQHCVELRASVKWCRVHEVRCCSVQKFKEIFSQETWKNALAGHLLGLPCESKVGPPFAFRTTFIAFIIDFSCFLLETFHSLYWHDWHHVVCCTFVSYTSIVALP